LTNSSDQSTEKLAKSLFEDNKFMDNVANQLAGNSFFISEVATQLILSILSNDDFKHTLYESLSIVNHYLLNLMKS